jgi:hypothetical protein
MRILSRATITHGIMHTTCMKKINLMRKKFVYYFHNDNTHIMNWANIESQAEKLAITNDTNIWMTKFSNANVHSPPLEITNYIGVETYNTNIKYVITPHIGMTTILDSNNIDAQDEFAYP